MSRKHTINGEHIPFTLEEEDARDAEEAAVVVSQQLAEQAEADRQVLTDSAHQKLRALGLTDAEIGAL